MTLAPLFRSTRGRWVISHMRSEVIAFFDKDWFEMRSVNDVLISRVKHIGRFPLRSFQLIDFLPSLVHEKEIDR